MKNFARFAVLGAALVAAAPFASASSMIYGSINTVGSSIYTNPPATTFNVSSTGLATLDLVTPGSSTGSLLGAVTGPPATGLLLNFYGPTTVVTDYSFNSSSISSTTPVLILTLSNGTDTVGFYATAEGAFTASNSTTEGAVTLAGYLTDISGSNYTTNYSAVLNVAANGLGNNFTEDLTAPTPEPNSLMLLGTGLVSAGGMLFRRRKVNA